MDVLELTPATQPVAVTPTLVMIDAEVTTAADVGTRISPTASHSMTTNPATEVPVIMAVHMAVHMVASRATATRDTEDRADMEVDTNSFAFGIQNARGYNEA